jgi:hypothetical protein
MVDPTEHPVFRGARILKLFMIALRNNLVLTAQADAIKLTISLKIILTKKDS